MQDETAPPFKVDPPAPGAPPIGPSGPFDTDSKIFDVSVRSLLTLLVVATVCLMSVWGLKIEEPLYTLVGMIVGYYFGQSKHKVAPAS